MPRKGKAAELTRWLDENRPACIGEAEFASLLKALAPVSESYLRTLVRECGVPLAPLVEGVRQGTFDVIVMNGRMPGGCSAREMYEWIAQNCHGLEKGLLLTFSTVIDEQTRAFLQQNGVPWLSKPFEMAELISHVRGLIHREGSAALKEKASTAGAGA